MTKKHKPRSGSLAYYPRKKAAKETPSFRSMPEVNSEETKALNFFGYKAGMVQANAKDDRQKGIFYGQNISVPCTALECPAIKVFGIRAYAEDRKKKKVLGEVWAEKTEKHLKRKIRSLKKKKEKNREKKKEREFETVSDLEKSKETISEIRLLVHTQPHLTGIGKKKPEVSEIHLNGKVEGQLEFAKKRLGQELKASEVFKENQFLDVRAVTKGKGMQGTVKRFGVKVQRPKAKKRRVVGAISPWKPATVMRTVARPGQMGYQNRTEYNKRLLLIEAEKNFSPEAGFTEYGKTKNEVMVVAGSIPGARKRLVALREPIRRFDENRLKASEAEVAVKK